MNALTDFSALMSAADQWRKMSPHERALHQLDEARQRIEALPGDVTDCLIALDDAEANLRMWEAPDPADVLAAYMEHNQELDEDDRRLYATDKS